MPREMNLVFFYHASSGAFRLIWKRGDKDFAVSRRKNILILRSKGFSNINDICLSFHFLFATSCAWL